MVELVRSCASYLIPKCGWEMVADGDVGGEWEDCFELESGALDCRKVLLW